MVWDHPRSRGVYGMAHRPGGRRLGSSPLARGLPGDDMADQPRNGIIPARAGFTRWRPHRGTPSTDHPRSRGVYELPPAGLCTVLRIIPARAGFTERAHLQSLTRADHPRSRGVYSAARTARANAFGSSPLARGLPGRVLLVCRSGRIIPARAGFTCRRWGRSSAGRDHPRSRGVYVGMILLRAADAGSSPLARGLLRLELVTAPVVRIIPARAGFTPGAE